MDLHSLIKKVKSHPDFSKAGMILSHNGIVRETSRNGEKVSGLSITVNHQELKKIIDKNKSRPGIIEILVEIADEGKTLKVGEDVMYIVVAGDIRENVIDTLTDTLNKIKKTVTGKTEFFV